MVASKNDKADVLLHYLTGIEFRQRVEAIAEAFSDMKTELDNCRTLMGKTGKAARHRHLNFRNRRQINEVPIQIRQLFAKKAQMILRTAK